MSDIRLVDEIRLDRWDFILQNHLHYCVTRSVSPSRGWLPDIPKAGIDYLQRKFRGRWMVVKCGETTWEYHVIAVSRKGRVALINHPNWRREYAFGQLGGKVPNCLYIARNMFDVRDRPYLGDFPEDLNQYCHEQMEKYSRRRDKNRSREAPARAD